MAQNYGSENEIAAAKVRLESVGADKLEKEIKSIQSAIDDMKKSLDAMSGGGNGGSGGDSGGGGGGEEITGGGGGASGGNGGFAGLLSTANKVGKAFLNVFAIRRAISFTQEINEMNIKLLETRARINDITGSLEVLGVGRAALRGAISDATGIPEIALRAKSQGPAQEAVRAAGQKLNAENLEKLNSVQASVTAWDEAGGPSQVFWARGAVNMLKEALRGADLIASPADVERQRAKMVMDAILHDSANRDAVGADGLAMQTQLRNISSGQRR